MRPRAPRLSILVVLVLLASFFGAGGALAAAFTYSASAGLPLAITDDSPSGVTNTMTVSGNGGTIADLNVGIGITHPFVGQLIVTLTHVASATTVTLIDRPGRTTTGNGCSGDNVSATLDDEASSPVESACPPTAGPYTPNNPLSAFDGLAVDSNWSLNVSDNQNGNTGSLTAWSISGTSTVAHALNVTVVGNGDVTSDVGGIDCPDDADPGDCSDTFEASTVVTLTATPDANHEFDGWTGDDAADCAAGAANPVCALTMTEQMDVTATFSTIQWDLNVTVIGDGDVTSSPAGIDCPDDADPGDCSATYDQPTVVTLIATPDADHEFDGWTGADAADCALGANNAVCGLTMTEQMDLQANFSTIQRTLIVTVVGNGTVTSNVSGAGNGIDCPDDADPGACADVYDQPTVVTLTATPDANHEFDGWTGADAADCAGGASNPVCELTMNQTKSVTANFSTIQWNLNVTVSGNGTVTSSPAGIDCPDDADPGDCSATFDQATVVTLTATPDANWQLNGWGGADELDCVIGTNTCTLTMTEDMDISASFGLVPRLLTLTVTGSAGTVTDGPAEGSVSCSVGNAGSCTELYAHGTSVTLTAAPDTNHEFDGWSGANAGDCASATPEVCVLTMDGAKALTATFSTIQRDLNVTVNGNGDVTSDVGGIDCPDVLCSATYDQPTVVTLTATPDPDHEFDGWSGDDAADCVSATPEVCALTMTEQMDVTAAFDLVPPDSDEADLTLRKNDIADPVLIGGNVDYRLRVRNLGPDAATTVVVTDTLPAGVSYVSATPTSGTCDENAGTVTCQLGTIAVGGTWGVRIVVTPSEPGTLDNTASVASAVDDPVPGNNSDVESTTVEETPPPGGGDVWSLGVTVQGLGAVTSANRVIRCGPRCNASLDSGVQVTLTALARPGTTFEGWTGDCTGTSTTCVLTMTQDLFVTATFAPAAPVAAAAGPVAGASPTESAPSVVESEPAEPRAQGEDRRKRRRR